MLYAFHHRGVVVVATVVIATLHEKMVSYMYKVSHLLSCFITCINEQIPTVAQRGVKRDLKGTQGQFFCRARVFMVKVGVKHCFVNLEKNSRGEKPNVHVLFQTWADVLVDLKGRCISDDSVGWRHVSIREDKGQYHVTRFFRSMHTIPIV